MNIRTILTLLCLCTTVALFAQDKINYHTGYKVEWKDFKGKVPKATSFHALTNSGISFATSTTDAGDSLEIQVLCYFDKTQSWTKKDKQKPILLDHERLHWDITEVYARQLRQALAKSDYRVDELNTELGKLFQKYVSEQDKRQELYDHETDHSKVEEEQKRWQEEIAAELESLSAWADPAIRIALKR